MVQLTRKIRFSLAPSDDVGPITNSWAGWPSTNRIVPYLELACTVSGQPDKQTGYICNIKVIDDLLRNIVTEKLIPEYDSLQTAEQIIAMIYSQSTRLWSLDQPIEKLNLTLSPYLNYTINKNEPAMISVTQQFEFSASHRLHCDELSAEDNQKLFGKCNNPNGHGHNYVVEATVAREINDSSEQVIGLNQFEATVKRLVVDRLDHKHLNKDVDYFREVNPSVENISIAIWNWLEGELGSAKLTCIRVYETPKTWAEYRGNA